MKRYTLQELIEIIKILYGYGENLAEAVRKTRTFLGRREAPCRTAIKKLVEKFELLGSDVKNKNRVRRSKTAHTSNETIDLLREKFPDRVSIFRRGDQNWPPRSCDLTPCDFFLWGHVKEKVYANNPASIEDLKDGIREAIEDIGQPLCCYTFG